MYTVLRRADGVWSELNPSFDFTLEWAVTLANQLQSDFDNLKNLNKRHDRQYGVRAENGDFVLVTTQRKV